MQIDPARVINITKIASNLISFYEGNHKLTDDGKSVKSYWDPNGRVWTIGRGLTGPDITKDTVWTVEYADERFRRALAYFTEGVFRLVTVGLVDEQYASLVSFAYNLGLDEDTDEIPEGLGDSTLLKLVNAGDWHGAAAEFPKWDKAWDPVTKTRKPLRGLTKRRRAERDLFCADGRCA